VGLTRWCQELTHEEGEHFRMGVVRQVAALLQLDALDVRQSLEQDLFTRSLHEWVVIAADQQDRLSDLRQEWLEVQLVQQQRPSRDGRDGRRTAGFEKELPQVGRALPERPEHAPTD
jgi:hypothetical protein